MLDVKITAILIDADRKSLNDSMLVLQQFNELSIVGNATSGKRGLALCNSFYPQLVIVNINLPDITGLDFAQMLRSRKLNSEIIFIASNTQYAYESLDVQPFDFFVEPLESELIAKMIARFKQKLKKHELFHKMDLFAQQQQVSAKRVFPQKKGIIVLHLNEILYCKAELTKTKLQLCNGEIVVVKTPIKATLEIINDRNFISTNRSYFINKSHLRKIDKKKHKCILHNNGQIWEVPATKIAIATLEKLNAQAIF